MIMNVDIAVKKCWCGSSRFKPYKKGLYQKSCPFELQSCVDCGMAITRFASGKSINYEGSYLYEEMSYRHYESLKTIQKNLNPGSLVEIGCNIGVLLSELKNRNPQLDAVSGIEIDEQSVSLACNRGVHVEKKYIQQLEGVYDNIIVMHVLEHVPDIDAFFHDLKRISRKNTMIYFAVPNIHSFNALRGLGKWGALNPEEHIWHFSKKTFSLMLQKHMPESAIVEIKTSWIWPHRIDWINRFFPGDQLEIVVKVQ